MLNNGAFFQYQLASQNYTKKIKNNSINKSLNELKQDKYDTLLIDRQELCEIIDGISQHKIKDIEEEYKDETREDIIKNRASEWLPSIGELSKYRYMDWFKPYQKYALHTKEQHILPAAGVLNFGQTIKFEIKSIANNHAITDCILNLKFSEMRSIDPIDQVKYTEMLGNRVAKKVTMRMGQWEFSYDNEAYNVYYYKEVNNAVKLNYQTLIGQEIPQPASTVYDPLQDNFGVVNFFTNGYQTFKNVQKPVEIFLPLLFWFRQQHQMLYKFCYDTLFIEIELSPLADLVAISQNHGDGSYTIPLITSATLDITYNLIDPAIYNIISQKYTHQLIRCYKTYKFPIIESKGSVKVSNVFNDKIEMLYVGVRPISNYLNSKLWYRNAFITAINYWVLVPDIDPNPDDGIEPGNTPIPNIPFSVDNPDSDNTYEYMASANQGKINYATVYQETNPLKLIGVKVNEMFVHQERSPVYYSEYEQNNSPIQGHRYWNCFKFNNEYLQYQPTGCLNISKSSEAYITYESNIDDAGNALITPQTPCNMIIIAVCLKHIIRDSMNNNVTIVNE